MKVKGITLDEMRPELLNTPEAIRGYNEADRELALLAVLDEIEQRSGLRRQQIAKRMNISQSGINSLMANPLNASVKTLSRFATACGADIDFKPLY